MILQFYGSIADAVGFAANNKNGMWRCIMGMQVRYILHEENSWKDVNVTRI